MIVIKCQECKYKQFCTDHELKEVDPVVCRSCQVIIEPSADNISFQQLDPVRMAEWWHRLGRAEQQTVRSAAAELRRRPSGYGEEEALVIASEKTIQKGTVLRDFFEPVQDEDFARAS